MSCTPIFSVHCDNAGHPLCHGWAAQEGTKRSARKTARARGWWSGRSGGGIIVDYCPACRRLKGL